VLANKLEVSAYNLATTSLLDDVYDKTLALNRFRDAVAASNELLTYLILVSNEALFTNVEEVNDNIDALKAFIDAVVDNILALNKFRLAVAASNELLTYLILVSKEALLVRVDEVKFNTEELNAFKLAVVDNILALNRFSDAVAASNEELT
jgi:hypothetical protein